METIKQVTLLLEKVQKDWNRALISNKITRIDKDILIEDIRQLYEWVHDLEIGAELEQNLQEASSTPQLKMQEPAEEEPEKSEKSTEIQEPEVIAVKPESHDEVIEEPEKSQDPNEVELEIVTETESATTPESDVEERDDEKEREQENHDLAEEASQPSASEMFTASKTLADIYRANGDNSIAAKMQKNKLSDLKSAIGLNEKFLFINEIFGGDTAHYKAAIDKFNLMNHYHEALQYLDEIKAKNKVNNHEACSAFVEILKRRFQ